MANLLEKIKDIFGIGTLEDEAVRRYCQVEYGAYWTHAYYHWKKHKKTPINE